MALGACIGFLPCCLSWAMILTAASTMDSWRGFKTMMAFGLGTIPALFCAGLFASFMTARTRLLGERAAGFAVAAMCVHLLLTGLGVIS
ncbi:MAG: hypothetical protein HGA63_04460 [Syntrophobacteraceae bacterium]|nr:hypothetical protein [Syntrophobacteraceae bacterium]